MATKQKGAGTRKYDRNRKSGQNQRYIAENRHGKSRARRLSRHLQRFPADECAQAVFDALGGEMLVKKRAA